MASVWTVSRAGSPRSSSCVGQREVVAEIGLGETIPTFGTTPTPSPINIGATVTMTVSTTGVPFARGGLRRNDDKTFDPPSIMTDFRPSVVKMPGSAVGAIRPGSLVSQDTSFGHETGGQTFGIKGHGDDLCASLLRLLYTFRRYIVPTNDPWLADNLVFPIRRMDMVIVRPYPQYTGLEREA